MIRRISNIAGLLTAISIFMAVTIVAPARAAEDLKKYGEMMKTFNDKSAALDQKYNAELERIRRDTPPEKRQEAIYNATQNYKKEGAKLVKVYREPVIEKLAKEADKDGKNPLGMKAGTPVDSPNHRGPDGDTDLTGTAAQADRIQRTAQKMGLSDADVKGIISKEPGSDTYGGGLNLTVHKDGKLGPVGSSAQDTQVKADANSHESYVSVGMKDGQPGKSYVAVQDHSKKAAEGLNMDSQKLLNNPNALQGMAKGTSKTIEESGLSDKEIKTIMDKNGIQGTPRDFKQQLQGLKEGHARAPDGVGVNSDNISKIQSASKDIIQTATDKTKVQAQQEIHTAQQKVADMQKSSDPGVRKQASELKGQIIDSTSRVDAYDPKALHENTSKVTSDIKAGNGGQTKTEGKENGNTFTQTKTTQNISGSDGKTTEKDTTQKTVTNPYGSSIDKTTTNTKETSKDGGTSETKETTTKFTPGSSKGSDKSTAGDTKSDKPDSDSGGTSGKGAGAGKDSESTTVSTKSTKTVDKQGNQSESSETTKTVSTKDGDFVDKTEKTKSTAGGGLLKGSTTETDKTSTATPTADGGTLTTESGKSTTKTAGGLTTKTTYETGAGYEKKFGDDEKPKAQGSSTDEKTTGEKVKDAIKKNAPDVTIAKGDLGEQKDEANTTKNVSTIGKGPGGTEYQGSAQVQIGQTGQTGGYEVKAGPDGVKATVSGSKEANIIKVTTQGEVTKDVGNVKVSLAGKGEATVGADVKGNATAQVGPDGAKIDGGLDIFAGLKLKGEIEGKTTVGGVVLSGKGEGALQVGMGGTAKFGLEVSWTGVKVHTKLGATFGAGGEAGFTGGVDASGVDMAGVEVQNKSTAMVAGLTKGIKDGTIVLPAGKTIKDVVSEMRDKATLLANHPELKGSDGKPLDPIKTIADSMGMKQVAPDKAVPYGTKPKPDADKAVTPTKPDKDKSKTGDKPKPKPDGDGNKVKPQADKPDTGNKTPDKPKDEVKPPEQPKDDGLPKNDAGQSVKPDNYDKGDKIITKDGTEYVNKGDKWVPTGDKYPPYDGSKPTKDNVKGNEANTPDMPTGDGKNKSSQPGNAMDNVIGDKNSKSDANTKSGFTGMQSNQDMQTASTAGDQDVRNANNTVNQAGNTAQNTVNNSSTQTAAAGDKGSWWTTIKDAVTAGIQQGASTFGNTIGGGAADAAGDKIFGTGGKNGGKSSGTGGGKNAAGGSGDADGGTTTGGGSTGGGSAGGGTPNPDGTISNPDGTITNPDGTITNPDGTITNPDGTVVPNPNGGAAPGDGTATGAPGATPGGAAPDGNVITVSGSATAGADGGSTTSTNAAGGASGATGSSSGGYSAAPQDKVISISAGQLGGKTITGVKATMSYDAYGIPDSFSIIYNGSSIAGSGMISNGGTISGSGSGNSPSVTFRVQSNSNTGTGWEWTGSVDFYVK